MRDFKSWTQRHWLLWILILLVLFNVIGGLLSRISPNLSLPIQLIWLLIIFIGMPILIYEEFISKKNQPDKNSSQVNQILQKEPHQTLRKVLGVVYSISLPLSFLLALASMFVFAAPHYSVATYGTFLSGILLPISFIQAMKLNKKSLLWFLLPILPLVTLILFGNAI